MYNSIVPTVVGHPFHPSGRGEDSRCAFRSFREIAVRSDVVDIFGFLDAETSLKKEIGKAITEKLGSVNVFFINGNEVEQSFAHLGDRIPKDSYNIICPTWELSHYPKPWADQLNRFNEIWAPTRFIKNSIEPTVAVPVMHMPYACEVSLTSFLGRRYFGIPESNYAFVFFFDFRSYVARKNPQAILKSFHQLIALHPNKKVSLVIKLNGSDQAPEQVLELKQSLVELQDRVILIDRVMTDNEIKNLVRCCDCFISLHRSEGFGRGPAEAMYFGRPVIATGYSGNMDFMNEENSFPVKYTEVEVKNGEYPFPENQVWAEPDIDHTVSIMSGLLNKPETGVKKGVIGRLTIEKLYSYRQIGLAYQERINQILREQRIGISHRT